MKSAASIHSRALFATLGGVTALLLVAVLGRLLAHDKHMYLVWLSSVTVYLYLPAYLVAALAAGTKRWALLGASGFVAVCHLLWLSPQISFATEPAMQIAEQRTFRLFSANLLMINPETRAIIEEIKDAKADVLLLQEYSPRWHRAIGESGITQTASKSEGVVREDSFGIAIYSSLLTEAHVWDVEGLPMVRGTIEVDGEAIQVINVHTLPPRMANYTEVWNKQMQVLLDTIKQSKGAFIVVGDFNATPYSAWYQKLTATRLRDCHTDRGRGLATTFPNGVFPLPPLRLDYVFVSPEIECLDIREGEGRHSDHQPIIATLGLR